ncbi:MAG: branched-subunit amino acid aminotransferase/4-amino-4-deoxychorismate lyase [Roseivirga sp.]|jgi:branched-subunit amino acid aminotransferase/4-amino-4-deoxychorismate lyase
MKAIFNSRVTSLEEISLLSKNRAFCYGDGLFETIVTGPQRINLIDLHLQRLKRGCEVLNLDFQGFKTKKILKMISEIAEENGISGTLRARLQLWRKPGGLYSPSSNESEFLLEVNQSTQSAFSMANGLDISEKANISYSTISFAKTMSALPYVLAGIEMREKELDDIILLNSSGYLAETNSSNLFWVKDNIIFTPALSTGCIEGVMRTFVMSQMEVKQVLASPSVLNFADFVFTTNASGIKYFTKYRDRNFGNPEKLLDSLIKRLQQP